MCKQRDVSKGESCGMATAKEKFNKCCSWIGSKQDACSDALEQAVDRNQRVSFVSKTLECWGSDRLTKQEVAKLGKLRVGAADSKWLQVHRLFCVGKQFWVPAGSFSRIFSCGNHRLVFNAPVTLWYMSSCFLVWALKDRLGQVP